MSVDVYMSREINVFGMQEVLEVNHQLRTIRLKKEKYKTIRLPSNRLWHLSTQSPQLVSKYKIRELRLLCITKGYVEVTHRGW